MKPRAVVLREVAASDVEQAVDWYRREAGGAVAARFVDAIESAFARIAHDPAAGSTRYAQELDLRGLRTWQVQGFPHLVFYVEAPAHVDVWRVLHEARDLPATIGQEPA